MTSTFSTSVLTFSLQSKDSYSTANDQFRQRPKSVPISCTFFFKENSPTRLPGKRRPLWVIAQHFIKCPSPSHTLGRIAMAGLNDQGLCPLGLGERPPNIEPQRRVLLPRKWWHRCSSGHQGCPLPGSICNAFTTEYQDFWQSTEQVNTCNLSGLL